MQYKINKMKTKTTAKTEKKVLTLKKSIVSVHRNGTQDDDMRTFPTLTISLSF